MIKLKFVNHDAFYRFLSLVCAFCPMESTADHENTFREVAYKINLAEINKR